MTQVELGYGRATLPFEFEGGRFRVLESESAEERPLTDAEVGAAIDDPLDSQPLEDILSPGESVLIVVSDATRATGSAQVVNLLVRRLIALGVAPYDLRIIFATGLHRAVTREEKAELLSPFIVQRVRALAHDASDESSHVSLGSTERGTPIELDRALFEHSHVILTGAVGSRASAAGASRSAPASPRGERLRRRTCTPSTSSAAGVARASARGSWTATPYTRSASASPRRSRRRS
jgi:nickel-dependent lactate racemase